LLARTPKNRGLELAEEKTRIVHIDQGFDFLAQEYRFLLVASSVVTAIAPSSHRAIEFRCH
jgi:hypothetical protein